MEGMGTSPNSGPHGVSLGTRPSGHWSLLHDIESHHRSCIKKGEQDKATQNKASKVARAGKDKTCQKKEGILKSASIPKRPRRPPATTG